MGCQHSQDYTMIPLLTRYIIIQNKCFTENNGSITVGREIGDEIVWDHTNQKDKFALTNLSPGTYCFEYTDFPSRCSKRECVEIIEIQDDLKLEFSEIIPIFLQKNGYYLLRC